MDWVLGFTTLLSMELVARRRWEGWAVGLANQLLWAWLIYSRELWGLIPLCAALIWRYAIAMHRWRQDARRPVAD